MNEELFFKHNNDVENNLNIMQGLSALMYASKGGNLEVAKILIEKGADVNMKSNASILSLFKTVETKF